jgi:hypothetical protein
LKPCLYLSREAQQQAILAACGITNIVAKKGNIEREVNVFNSSNIRSTNPINDPDLGSPNCVCPGSGPGIGAGGVPTSKYPNCDPLGNLLIIQNTDNPESDPNDSPLGGCITFEFGRAVELVNMGLLDVEERTEIKVRKWQRASKKFSCLLQSILAHTH